MMEADIVSRVPVLFRFVHVLAAIRWIGNSLLFTWMEFNLQKPAKKVRGICWARWTCCMGAGFSTWKNGFCDRGRFRCRCIGLFGSRIRREESSARVLKTFQRMLMS